MGQAIIPNGLLRKEIKEMEKKKTWLFSAVHKILELENQF